MSKLSIVATPIGNLRDITLRALDVLSESDLILCEDTRSTKKLLEHHNIHTRTIAYHEHSGSKRVEYILDLLEQGKHLALVSEAGTPGISDPGGKLVQEVVERYGSRIDIEAIPGPSAVTAALSIAGLPTHKFTFLGFPPHKKGRKKFLYSIFDAQQPVVIYESKHRILKFLEEIQKARNTLIRELGDNIKVDMVVCRELTKMHESVYRGSIEEIYTRIVENWEDAKKGEFVIIMNVTNC